MVANPRASSGRRCPGAGLVPLAALDARRSLRITRPVAMVSSIRVPVPVIVGHLKPVIVLPAAALAGLSPAHLEAVIAHELADVRRHDYLVNLAQTVIETLLFYHPAVWWVSHHVRVAREHCCDDIAVTVCRSRRDIRPCPARSRGTARRNARARARRHRWFAACAWAPAADAGAGADLATATGRKRDRSDGVSLRRDWRVVQRRPRAREPALELTTTAPAPATCAPGRPAANATPVIVSPDSTGPLGNAGHGPSARRARRGTGCTGLATASRRSTTLPAFVYYDRSGRIGSGDMTFSGRIQSSDMSGLRIPGRPLACPPPRTVVSKVLFELDASRGEPTLASVHLSTLPLPVETKDLPVFWLGAADGRAESRPRRSVLSGSEGSRGQARPRGRRGRARQLGRRGARGSNGGSPARSPTTCEAMPPNASRMTRSPPRSPRWIARRGRTAAHTFVRRPLKRSAISRFRGGSCVDRAGEDADRSGRTARGRRGAGRATEPAAAEALTLDRKAGQGSRNPAGSRGNARRLRGQAWNERPARPRSRAIPTSRSVARRSRPWAMPFRVKRPVGQLKKFLADPDPAVVEEAVDAIAASENESSRATLMELARSHSSLDVRREAVEALAQHAGGQGEGQASSESRAIVDLPLLARDHGSCPRGADRGDRSPRRDRRRRGERCAQGAGAHAPGRAGSQ